MATAKTEDKHRKVIVTPRTREDEGMDGYARVNEVIVKYRFGEPTSLRGSIIDFLREVTVVTRTHEEYTDIDKKRKKRVIKKEVPRYGVFELGKDFKLGADFDGMIIDGETVNQEDLP